MRRLRSLREPHRFMTGPDSTSNHRDPRDHFTGLIAASRDRTLRLHLRDGEALCLRKVFETGGASAAEHEAELLRRLAHAGFPRVLDATTDEASGRPCLELEWLDALDLENDVAQHGPLTPQQTAGLGAALAARLGALHGAESTGAKPAMHGDIKPANLVGLGMRDDSEVTDGRLLDAEHALLLAEARERQGFTGGTHGYAPPEALQGAAPHPGFDVFGLGATLVFALTGRPPSDRARHRARHRTAPTEHPAPPIPARIAKRLGGISDALLEAILACLDPQPEKRPSATNIASRLREIAAAEVSPLDQAWSALHRGAWEEAEALTKSADGEPADAERTEWLIRRARRVHRIHQRWPNVQTWLAHTVEPTRFTDHDSATDAPCPVEHARLVTHREQLHGTQAWLRRFPSDPEARELRAELRDAAVSLLMNAPEAASLARAATEFTEASNLLHQALALRETCGESPGTFPARRHLALQHAAPHGEATQSVHPVLRDGQRTLRSALEATALEAAEFNARLAELQAAECAFDRPAAQRAIASLAEKHGGAVHAVAKLRDREHRFRYALERFSASRETLNALRSLPEFDKKATPTEALNKFLERAAVATKSRRAREDMNAHPRSPAGLRTLAQEIEEFVTEFPHLQGMATEPKRQCDALLDFTSEIAWTVLGEAQGMLDVHPVPLRPLNTAIHRLDTFVHGELLGDNNGPGRSRSAFFDALESARRRVDQARATRDRIAHGAQEAMARGHWTTALYDMQRAVEQSPQDDDASVQLVEELEQAREKKERLEQAKLDNVRLASQIAQLDADPNHDREQLRQMLDERADVLELMVRLLPAGSVQRFRDDLAGVRRRIIEDRVAATEAAMARAGEDLGKQRDLVDDLLLVLTTTDADQENDRRTAVSTWRNKREHLNMLLEARTQKLAEQVKRARRNRALGATATFVVLGSLLAWFVSSRSPVVASGDGSSGGSPSAASAADFEVRTPGPGTGEARSFRFDAAVIEAREANAWAALPEATRGIDALLLAREALSNTTSLQADSANSAWDSLLAAVTPGLQSDRAPAEHAWSRAALRLGALRAAEATVAETTRWNALRERFEAAPRAAGLSDLVLAMRGPD